MPKIIPLHGSFNDWRALLGRIMEDDEAYGVVVIAFCRRPEDDPKDNHVKLGHCGVTRGEISVASTVLLGEAIEILYKS